MRPKAIITLFFVFISTAAFTQVKIRLFSNQSPESAVFSVTEGEYKMNFFNGVNLDVTIGESVVITKCDGRLAVKKKDTEGFICDSLTFTGDSGNASFSLRVIGDEPAKQFYSGDLTCFPDLETLVLINKCDIEKYIAGVVKAEGGNGKNEEYFKSQAVIARTYMYKYINKHMADGYNLCDNTHCQAFNGTSTDTIISMAAMETKGQVILDHDSTLIISAFHSNCGGETSYAEYVWLSNQPYLKKVIDPYCTGSRNASWRKSLSISEWIDIIRKSGYTGPTDNPSVFNFIQKTRVADYTSGSFAMPLRTIRNNLNLRSAFFSVAADGDSIILSGKGYGHGVGLCQEGAMAMAAKGFDYTKIIGFYYYGVIISDIKNAVNLP